MLNLRRIAAGSLHLWKREMKIATPTRMAPFSSSSENANSRQSDGAAGEKAKSSIFEKLGSLIGETLDFIMREEEKKGISVTKADLVGWAEQLNKQGKHEYAVEIFEWMDKKKMIFSPSELALFVDLLAETKGLAAATEYFWKVEPDFDTSDFCAKNWPAYVAIERRGFEIDKKSGIKLAVRRYRLPSDDPDYRRRHRECHYPRG